jgi:hypothetical protein
MFKTTIVVWLVLLVLALTVVAFVTRIIEGLRGHGVIGILRAEQSAKSGWRTSFAWGARCRSSCARSTPRFPQRSPRAHSEGHIRRPFPSRLQLLSVSGLLSERSSNVSRIAKEAHGATRFVGVMKVRAPRSNLHTTGAPQTTMSRPPSRTCRSSGAQRSSAVVFHPRW